MKISIHKKYPFLVVLFWVFMVSCKDNCDYKYNVNIEVELEGVSDRSLINTEFITQYNDTIRIDNLSNIVIGGGGDDPREKNVYINFRLGSKMKDGKILINYSGKVFILDNLKHETFICDPGTFQKTKNFIEFRSFDFGGSKINLIQNSISQSYKGKIKL